MIINCSHSGVQSKEFQSKPRFWYLLLGVAKITKLMVRNQQILYPPVCPKTQHKPGGTIPGGRHTLPTSPSLRRVILQSSGGHFFSEVCMKHNTYNYL